MTKFSDKYSSNNIKMYVTGGKNEIGFTGFIGFMRNSRTFGNMARGYGLFKKGGRNAFIWGVVMTVLSVLSLLMSIFNGSFNFGDILLLILAGAYTYSTIKLV